MCGIVGFISTRPTGDEKVKKWFMAHALSLDTLRGEDSTGVFTGTKDGTIEKKRSLRPGIAYIGSQEFRKIDFARWFAVGHNRAATKGEVSLANAHPFTFGDITLVHNGTLYAGGASLKTYDQNLEVDSMQIANALSLTPPDEAASVLENIDGSFALVWFDKRDKSLNIARNSERPLHFTYNSKQDTMFFMSDGLHLTSINKGLRGSVFHGNQVYSLRAQTHMKFKEGDLRPKAQSFKKYTVPILGATPNNESKNDSGRSLRRATKRWQDNLRGNAASSSINRAIRTEINGKKRKVPQPQEKLVEKYWGLSTKDYLEFVPLADVECGYKKHIVIGEVILPAWGGATWPATIMNVPTVQVRAYKDTSWLVSPIGIAMPHDKDYDYDMMVNLIHCDYAGWAEENEEVEEEDDPSGKLMVPGPGGQMIENRLMKDLLTNGCVSCSGSILDEDLDEAILVNEGRDLLCGSCVDDFKEYDPGIVESFLH